MKKSNIGILTKTKLKDKKTKLPLKKTIIIKHIFLIIFIIFPIPIGFSSEDNKRNIALVIGNDSYKTFPNLNNAVRDSDGVAKRLADLGWKVIHKKNQKRREFLRTLYEFKETSKNFEASLIFFAGHGVEDNTENYLIPSDSEIEDKLDLKTEAISLGDLVETFNDERPKINIVILDMCRNNPLMNSFSIKNRGLKTPGITSGHQEIAILYSTSPGSLSSDGKAGGYGLFTKSLLESLNGKNLSLESVFKSTARRVIKRSNGNQKPWIHSSVSAPFYFDGEIVQTQVTGSGKNARGLKNFNDLHDHIAKLIHSELLNRKISEELDKSVNTPSTRHSLSIFSKNKTISKWGAQPSNEADEKEDYEIFSRDGVKLKSLDYRYYLTVNSDIRRNDDDPKVVVKKLLELLSRLNIFTKDIQLQKLRKILYTKKAVGPINIIFSKAFSDPVLTLINHHIRGIEVIKEKTLTYKEPGLKYLFEFILSPCDFCGVSKPAHTTLDYKIYKDVQDVLLKYKEKFSARAAFSVLIDANNFEILSINEAGDTSEKMYRAGFVYEFGSLLKTITAAIALEEGLVTLDSETATPEFRAGGIVFRNYRMDKSQIVSVFEAYLDSINTSFGRIGVKIGKERWRKWIKTLGFDKKVNIFRGRFSSPLMPENIRPSYQATLGIGHNIALSQLHVAKAYAALVNGGYISNLRIFKEFEKADARQDKKDFLQERVVSTKISQLVRYLLLQNVVFGTGRLALVGGNIVGGKTGTAEYMGSSTPSIISSFAAAFPIVSPQYVLILSLDSPNGITETHGYKTGGWTAAPAVSEIVEKMIKNKKIRLDK